MFLVLLGLSLLVPAGLYAVCAPGDLSDRIASLRDRVLRRRDDLDAPRRPIEEITAEIHRLGRRYHSVHVSHTKAESLRQCYDQALVAGCAALGIDHLMTVIPPGPELDAERARVERMLHRWGIDLSDLHDAA